ncbi:hypothetical protein P7H17_00065 [Paenibacillus larvae]|nr:hypothetical protein [Paenibacillus larvae]MDT2284837.1 hypothetical protein [Paenibacillus larvae]
MTLFMPFHTTLAADLIPSQTLCRTHGPFQTELLTVLMVFQTDEIKSPMPWKTGVAMDTIPFLSLKAFNAIPDGSTHGFDGIPHGTDKIADGLKDRSCKSLETMPFHRPTKKLLIAFHTVLLTSLMVFQTEPIKSPIASKTGVATYIKASQIAFKYWVIYPQTALVTVK